MIKTRHWILLCCVSSAILGMGAVAGIYLAARGIATVLVAAMVPLVCIALWVVYQKMDADCRHQEEVRKTAHDIESRRARAFTVAVMDSLPHAVALITPGGQIELTNSRAAIFGLDAGKAIGAVPEGWLKPLVETAIAMRVASKPEKRQQLLQKFEEGRENFFVPQATPLLDPAGNLEGVMVVLIDVTESRQAEEAKSDLMSSFSHELKTPMTSLQMSIYLLIDDAASRLTPRQLDLLKSAREDADRLHRLLEEVLSVARERL